MSNDMKTITLSNYSEMRGRLEAAGIVPSDLLGTWLHKLKGRQINGFALATSLEIVCLREACRPRFFQGMEAVNYIRAHTSLKAVITALVDDEQVKADAFKMVDIFYREAVAEYQ